jgi:hypothetical protein
MKFRVTGSPIEAMNGDYEVHQYGLVKNLTQDRLLKPAIDYVVRWMCDMGGEEGGLWIGKTCWDLRPGNEEAIMQALGFEGWPSSVLEEDA